MLDHEDLKWIATTTTDLNTMLQQVSRYADLARQHKGEYNYVEMLGERDGGEPLGERLLAGPSHRARVGGVP